ncbi:MAG: hypothetical protein DRQ48_00830 [Gammaproteobacteria bacterium]|nr:MAG: hypothetical protein DRQ44_00540 [Gammaproteobacteria bacterium]RKZ72223.1 MAG: hypothetical protein DRQ48_00830 [Gammaproteobacteria bacterium]
MNENYIKNLILENLGQSIKVVRDRHFATQKDIYILVVGGSQVMNIAIEDADLHGDPMNLTDQVEENFDIAKRFARHITDEVTRDYAVLSSVGGGGA